MRLQSFMCVFLILLSCKEEDLERNYPFVKTLPVTGISADGATFLAEFSGANTEAISQHGFVWGKDKVNLAVGATSSCVTVQLGHPTSSQFRYDEKTSMDSAGLYYVRGYVQTNSKVVYGTLVSFTSLGSAGPAISDLSPKSGKQGDIITITGNNFGQGTTGVTVTFTAEDAVVSVSPLEVTSTSVKVTVPNTLYARTSMISIEVNGSGATATEPFILDTPEIESIASNTLSACDSLIVNWISHGFSISNVSVNDMTFPYTISGTEIKISIKEAPASISIKIQSGLFYDRKTFSNTPIGKQVISSFPGAVFSADTIKIRFNFHTDCHSFRANSMGTDLTEVGRTTNEVWYVPGQVSQSPQQITVFVDNVQLIQSPSITIQYKGWTRKQDFTGSNRNGAVGFEINGKGYMALGENSGGLKNDLWEYDPTTDQWTQKAQFPGAARLEAAAFVVNGKAYVGVGQTHGYGSAFQDFWEYNPVANSWVQKGDYPGGPRYAGCVTFSIGTKGYMGAGQYSLSTYQANDFWEYEPTNDTWTTKATMVESYYLMSSFSQGSKGYSYWTVNGIAARFMYDPVTNTWDTNLATPGIGNQSFYPLAFNNEVYFLSINSPNKVFRVDPETNQWTFVQYHGNTFYDFSFVVNQKAYTGMTSNLLVYQFDPSGL